MSGREVVAAFVGRLPAPGDPSLQIEGNSLMIDGWWPAALWLGPSTCLVRLDEGAKAEVPAWLDEELSATHLVPVDADLDAPLEAISVQRLGLIGAAWRIWSLDEPTARAAVVEALAG